MPLEKSTHQHASASSTTEAPATSSSGASVASNFFEKAVPSAAAFFIYELPQQSWKIRAREVLELAAELHCNIGGSIATLSDADDRKIKGQNTRKVLEGCELLEFGHFFACRVAGRLIGLACVGDLDHSTGNTRYIMLAMVVDPTYPGLPLAMLKHVFNRFSCEIRVAVTQKTCDLVGSVGFYERLGCRRRWHNDHNRLQLIINPSDHPNLWARDAAGALDHIPPAADTRVVSPSEGLNIAKAMHARVGSFNRTYSRFTDHWAEQPTLGLLDQLIFFLNSKPDPSSCALAAYFVGDDPVGLICAASFPSKPNKKESSWCMAGGVIAFPGYDEKEVHRPLLEKIVSLSGHGKIHIPCEVASACGQTCFFEEAGFLFKPGVNALALDAKKSPQWENVGGVPRCTGTGRGQQSQSQSSHSDQPSTSMGLAR